MKKLNKVLLTNWHYFSFETFTLSDINFLTGKNASGKTTLIDAIQLIILGDTSGHFFNKSAADKSSRSLKGYLKCEIGDNDDGSITYLRNGRFSSYVALEFIDTELNNAFTIGCVFDVYDDGSYDNKFFYFNDYIPDNNFIENNVPFDSKNLKLFLLSKYNDVEFFETNSSYREFIKVKFGNVNNNFFSLFKKAIPFAPISNIEQFITEYVCDVKNSIDVIKMQESVRNYKSLEIETTNLQKRVDLIEQINNKYNEWKDTNESILLSKYLFKRAEIALRKKDIEKEELNLEDLRNEEEDKNNILENCKKQIIAFNQQKDNLNEEKFNSDTYKKQKDYLKQKSDLEEKISLHKGGLENVINNVTNYVDEFISSISNVNYNSNYLKDLRSIANDTVDLLEKFDKKYIGEDNLTNIQSNIGQLLNEFRNKEYALRSKYNENNDQINALNDELDILSSGEKPYNHILLSFKESLKEYLDRKHNIDSHVAILADELDLKDESYRNAIEAYLGVQRFYIIVDENYVDDAIKYYRDNKQNFGLDIGIVDTQKVMEANYKEEPHSISSLITSNNKFAKAYINSLVGNLFMCDDINKLRDHKRSLMRDGMLYQGFVARSLNFRNLTPFIGSNSQVEQKGIKESEVALLSNENENILYAINQLRDVTSLDNLSSSEVKNIISALYDRSNIDVLEKQLQDVNELLASLSNNYIETLNKKIEEVTNTIQELEEERNSLIKDITLTQNNINSIETNVLPEKKKAYEELKKLLENDFSKDFVLSKGEPTFMEVINELKTPRNVYDKYFNGINVSLSQVNNLWKQVYELRIKYNTIYHTNNDPDVKDNEYYNNEYEELAGVRLKEYQAKIKEAKDNALDEFRNDFLAKLKANFDTVESQIESLNEALKHAEFGNDTYYFTVTPKKEFKDYFDMINDPMLLMNQDISSKEFYEKYDTIIEDLFRQITFIDESLSYDLRQELEQNIAKFTDYRSYLKFDLIVTDTATNNVQHLSRTLLKKSGGETQTPFYISILASFAQAYHIYLNGKDSSIRLIIFDEAFSKMDAERIMQAVKLLRNFGLQAIISAPPEKMGDIVPLVDKTLCVIRNNTISSVNEFKKNN